MHEIETASVALAIVGLAWAWVWDRKERRDCELCKWRTNIENSRLGAIGKIMEQQVGMVDKIRKPPDVPGDEWKNQ